MKVIAAKLEAVERALESTPADARDSLADGVRLLRARLDQGLDASGRLIAAAGLVLVGSSAAPSTAELTEATDHLAGLARALRELSDDSPG